MNSLLFLKNGNPVSNECILWTGPVNSGGYGPHREVYKIYYGHLDPDLDVMHECDVKRCVNPKHLKQGTHSKNQRDARDRGLTPIKLDAIMVQAIRERYAQGGITQTTLARRYNVTRQLIHLIVHNKIWQ